MSVVSWIELIVLIVQIMIFVVKLWWLSAVGLATQLRTSFLAFWVYTFSKSLTIALILVSFPQKSTTDSVTFPSFRSFPNGVKGKLRFFLGRSIGFSGCDWKMKLIQRRAYGYRNFQNYRLRVLIECGHIVIWKFKFHIVWAWPAWPRFLVFWSRFAPGGAVVGLASVQCLSGRRCWKSMQSKNRTRLLSDSVSWFKWSIADSNRWPSQCHWDALPTELIPRSVLLSSGEDGGSIHAGGEFGK